MMKMGVSAKILAFILGVCLLCSCSPGNTDSSSADGGSNGGTGSDFGEESSMMDTESADLSESGGTNNGNGNGNGGNGTAGTDGSSEKRTPDFLTPQKINNINDPVEVLSKLGKTPPAADVDDYLIHDDGGMIYDPLYREAKKTGKLNKYNKAAVTKGTVKLGGTVLEYSVPKNVTAYDTIPVKYKLTTDSSKPVHIAVNSFEDEAKRKGRDLYDMNLPGKVDVDYEYLGYVDGTFENGRKPLLSNTFNDVQGSAYPSYKTADLIKSGTVTSTNITWFKFKYTNTGDTILDSDGSGTFCFLPLLYKKNAAGQYEKVAGTINEFERIYTNLYPGESGEMWISFSNLYRYLPVGDFKIELVGLTRNEIDNPDYARIIWYGDQATQSSFEFSVSNTPKVTAPNAMKKDYVNGLIRNSWLHTYEEFLSSYETLLKPEKVTEGTIYVQPAPWTKELVVKLLFGNDAGIKTAAVPINVESDSIKLQLNPSNNNFVVKSDGTRYPAITAQNMADMRSNVQRGPYAASTIINDILDMKEAGVNYFSNTVAFGYDVGDNYYDFDLDANKFMMDVVRSMGYKMEMYSVYPYNTMLLAANNVSGQTIKASTTGHGDPGLAKANAILANYTFKRYGDMAMRFGTGTGTVPITIEDTRGWLRADLRIRDPIGRTTLDSLRIWLTKGYGNVKNLNSAYGSNFASINAINPETDRILGREKNLEFIDPTKVYGDWSKAITDFDLYRTVERANNYKSILSQTTVPNAKMQLRTEGANWLVAGINPETTNQRYRHVYYNQRRNAMVAEIMQASGAVFSHADYITLPYSPSEVYELTKKGVEQGVVSIHLPTFNRMREIAINKKYGDMSYTMDYNLKGLYKGAYMNTLSSVYLWFEATYNAGGVPGIIWADYLCDAFVTETQFKEMKFFKQKMDDMMNTAEGKKWASNYKINDDWRKNTVARYSYPKSYVDAMIKDNKRICIFN